MNINPLGKIAQLVALTPLDDQLPEVWHHTKETNLFGPKPADSPLNFDWSCMTSWQTIRKIEALMLDEKILDDVNAVQLKSLKNYCFNVMEKEGDIFNRLWSLLKHIFQENCWSSTASKASYIYNTIQTIQDKKKGHVHLSNFDAVFERQNKGDQGKSRPFLVKKDDHCSLATVKKGVGFINGIQNTYNDAIDNAEYLASFTGEEIKIDAKYLHPDDGLISNLFKKLPEFIYKPEERGPETLKGVHVNGVYNAMHTPFADLLESWFGWWGYCTKPTRKVIKMWKQFFDQNKDGKFLMFCHSQGAIHVKHALKALSEHHPELCKRIEVVAIAPGVYIHPDLCSKVIHYVSKYDFIHRFDWFARTNVVDLEPYEGASWLLPDHPFKSPTFKKYLKQSLENFIKS